ncbi:MAG TPA: zf-HC2 domain-containing protein, partial [Acidobacteriota bacterium]|nr:zf-HC2 domain-containing protein [Acidobacteriota bacterium]
MNCWRFDLWQKMTAYVHGELPAELVSRLEDHLSECESCRLRLERVQKSDQFAGHLPLSGANDDSWKKIEDRIRISRRLPEREQPSRYLFHAAAGVASLLAVFFIFVFYSDGMRSFLDRGAEEFYSNQYREVSLRDIPNSAEPHVYTEGYVSEVRMDREEGDTMFRLVDDL